MAHWQDKTGFTFVERTASNEAQYPNFINVKPAAGCFSNVGMLLGGQDIGLADGCSLGAAIHEIGHAIGLWHEQSREDRDQFIRINWQNIIPGRRETSSNTSLTAMTMVNTTIAPSCTTDPLRSLAMGFQP